MKELKGYTKYIVLFIVVLVIILLFVVLSSNSNKNEKSSKLTLELKGELNITIIKGDNYHESGYTAYDSQEGDLTNKVVVEGDINNETVGSYEIQYMVSNNRGDTVKKARIVNVIANLSDLTLNIDYDPKELTNEDVAINLEVSGDGFDFILDPDGNISKSNTLEYIAKENDEYLFSIKRKDGIVIEKTIEITNIDKKKPIGSCKNLIENGKSKITVVASDENGIDKYSYTIDGVLKNQSTSDTYLYEKETNNVVVTAYDKAGNYELINCITTNAIGPWPVDYHRDTKATSKDIFYKESTYGNNNYIIYYPKNLDLKEKNPLVIYLGGGGEIGSNIDLIRSTAFVNNMKKGIFKGAIYLAPQCRTGWEYCFSSLKTLIDNVVSQYNVDSKRISIMGHSHGAVSTYQMIARYQNFFSAAAILSGNTERKVGSVSLKNIKIIVYYGAKDSNITAGRIRTKALIDEGVNMKYIEFPNEGHTIQNRVINETNTIEWLIAQKKQ